MRALIIALLLTASSCVLAEDCPTLDVEAQKLSDAEETGQTRFKALLMELQAARGWNNAKLLSYSIEVNSRGELTELQRLRQIHASSAASLAFDPAAKCSDAVAAAQLATRTIEKQWVAANKELESDLSIQDAP